MWNSLSPNAWAEFAGELAHARQKERQLQAGAARSVPARPPRAPVHRGKPYTFLEGKL